ncbi:hypothetical protein Hanom_Chr04g00331531 [Helianthus anomalus]
MLNSSRVSGLALVHMSNPVQSGFKHSSSISAVSGQPGSNSVRLSLTWSNSAQLGSTRADSVNSVDPVNSVRRFDFSA